jgi:hypothetical protein
LNPITPEEEALAEGEAKKREARRSEIAEWSAALERRKKYLATLPTEEREELESEDNERLMGIHRIAATVRGTERHSARLVRLTWVLIVLTGSSRF